MELPGRLDVPERFVETTRDVVVAVHVEASAREAARAGLTLERAHDRPAPSPSALVFVHRDVVDPRHRRIIGGRAEPQNPDLFSIIRTRRDQQGVAEGRESIREERIERRSRSDLSGLARRLPVAFELRRVTVDRPFEIRDELIGEHRTEHGQRPRWAFWVSREDRDHRSSNVVRVHSQRAHDLNGDTLTLADETQQEMFGADVLITELTGFQERELEDLLRPRGERDLTGRHRLPAADRLFHLGPNRGELDAEGSEASCADTLTLRDEAQQQMLGPDVVVVEEPRFLLGEHDHAAGALREPLEHVASVLPLVARETQLAIELLQLLDVHPPMPAGDPREQLVHVLVREVARVLLD